VYGANEKMPFSVEDKVDRPISLYAATKKSNELIAHSYSHLFGLPTTGLRFFTVYGPWGRPDMAMYIFTDKISKGEPMKVFNNGNMKRDFTYIDDIISGIRSALDKNYKCEVFNLGNNRSEELMDMIKIIEKKLEKKAIIDFQPIQPGDVMESFADIEKSRELLGFSPQTDMKTGLESMIDWYNSYNGW
jgi:UDP-glucuronate 4-epimerase